MPPTAVPGSDDNAITLDDASAYQRGLKVTVTALATRGGYTLGPDVWYEPGVRTSQTFLVVALSLGLAFLAACARGDQKKCTDGCRNYYTLSYWHDAERDLAAVPAEQREALHKKQTDDFAKRLDDGLGMCVSQCQGADNDKEIDCQLKAKTYDEVHACMK